jgi:D-sedoheptulose 7-phosphate isomerase
VTLAGEELEARIGAELERSIRAKQRVVAEELSTLGQIAALLTETLWRGNKVLLFGNGGSAADAQHIAAELVSRFRRERSALPAIALTTDTSILTAIGNDYGFERVFSRQVEALGAAGDVALAISTSGNSPNVIEAVRTAVEMGLATVGFTGRDGGKLCAEVEICFRVPSASTPRIQEAHLAAAHALCEVIEETISARCG